MGVVGIAEYGDVGVVGEHDCAVGGTAVGFGDRGRDEGSAARKGYADAECWAAAGACVKLEGGDLIVHSGSASRWTTAGAAAGTPSAGLLTIHRLIRGWGGDYDLGDRGA